MRVNGVAVHFLFDLALNLLDAYGSGVQIV